jgi:hypothetical protein
MFFRSLPTLTCLLALNLWAATAFAQSDQWMVDFSGAAAPTVGVTNDHLKTGWNIDLGAERTFAHGVGLRGDFGYYRLGVTDQALRTLSVPNGDAHMFSLTAGPTWHFPIGSRVGGYVLGGVGWYRRTVEFLQPTVAVIDIIDPWWGYVGSEIVPASQILGSVSNNAFGGNVGGGVSIPLGSSGSAFFAELRYHRANTKTTPTAVLPVSFGIRWIGRDLAAP